MSYTPTTWKAGDTVTSEKLNKLEQGVASNGALIVQANREGYVETLDYTWKEIYDAALAGCSIFLKHYNDDGDEVYSALSNFSSIANSQWRVVRFYEYGMFEAASENEYPSYDFT